MRCQKDLLIRRLANSAYNIGASSVEIFRGGFE